MDHATKVGALVPVVSVNAIAVPPESLADVEDDHVVGVVQDEG